MFFQSDEHVSAVTMKTRMLEKSVRGGSAASPEFRQSHAQPFTGMDVFCF
jgi:hypothetical protein